MNRSTPVLDAARFRHYVDRFNALEETEDVVNLIPNAQSWDWIERQVPLFTCPDAGIEEIYYYRWWSFRKHIKSTPAGTIVTEFILPVRHAGSHNSISCATGHHIAEARWLRDRRFLDEYVRFWFRGNEGKPERKFHHYSSWIASALYDRWLVDHDTPLMLDLLDELIVDYETWEAEKLRPDGMFWQFDVRDGMEESISGSRKHRNARPTINSYMFANARDIARVARLAGRDDVAEQFCAKSQSLQRLVQDKLWDTAAQFFKAQTEEGPLSDAREAIGFIPWCFDLPDRDRGYEHAWAQLVDERGFWAPAGLTTAERRHPRFRSHGVGRCEWDGACWPFATSQTLVALSNVLRRYEQPHVTRAAYVESMRTYARAHHMHGKAYIGEYHDEVTGEWLKGDNPRSRFYNHSTFADLVIGGLVGIVPRADDVVEIDPMVPPDGWDWFCLDRVPYHGHELTVLWDRDGTKFGRGAGLRVFADGPEIATSPHLGRVEGRLVAS